MNEMKGDKDKNMRNKINISKKTNLKNLRKSSKGITLIALVITIVVLLILAAVSIATLTGENGILTRADDARENTAKETAREKVAVEVLGSYGEDGNIDYTRLNENLENVEGLTSGLPIAGLPATVIVDGYEVTIEDNGNVTVGDKNDNPPQTGTTLEEAKNDEMLNKETNTEVTVTDGTVTVPAGFQIAQDSGNTIDEGIVIEDNEENQFVWVPVENFAEFEREHFGTDSQKWWTGTFVTDGLSTNNLYEPTADGIQNSTEVQKMYKSVNDYDGFYVGRYEAGTSSSDVRTDTSGIKDSVVVKQGANVYNYIGWSNNNNMSIETGGAVQKSREFAEENGYTTVSSTLIYGVQWDAIMRWMKDEPNLTEGKYVQDSTGMGWYSNNYENGNPSHQTGINVDSNKSNCVKNIYDLAGNVWEWTMESYGTDVRVRRGGCYIDSGSNYPASNRYSSVRPSSSYSYIGFRVTLYLL